MMTKTGITNAVEDYLKIIYDLTISQERASTNQIAEALDVRPASVTGMIKKLSISQPPLVDYQKHYGVALTPEGEKIALEIIRHHRLLETFLHETLGFDWDIVHEEADRLEHVISEKFEERIAKALGNPEYDPHGDPIPTKELTMPSTAKIPLSTLRPGQVATIRRVKDDDSDLLKHLETIGFVPGTEIVVTNYSEFDGNLHIQIDKSDQVEVLGPKITNQIFVDTLG